MDYFYGTSPPPEYERYAGIVDAATLVQGLLWALNYGEASYRSIKDRTYGMAIFPLCCNYAWELVYTVIYSSQNKYERIIMTTWLILNSIMMGCTIKFAPNEWKHSPLVQRNLPLIFLAGVVAFVIAQLALTATVGPGLAMNWVAALCYLLLTIGSLCQLLTRGSSRGVSYTMWLSRFVGTYVGVICVYFRYNYWPQNFSWVDEPIMKSFSGISLAVEICYGFTLWHIRKEERRQSVEKSK